MAQCSFFIPTIAARRHSRLRIENPKLSAPLKFFSLRAQCVRMREVEVKRVFIGAGCNRIVNNVSWGASGLLSFGAHNAVAIFCPKVPFSLFLLLHSPFIFDFLIFLFFFLGCSQSAQILTTLPGHKAVVNCTHWLPSSRFLFKGTIFLHLLST